MLRRYAPRAMTAVTPNAKRRSGCNPAPALQLVSSARLRRVKPGDGLDLEIFLQAVFAPLAAVARLLVAAEWRGAVVRHALQIDVAGADPAADPAGGLDGIGGDGNRETIGRGGG